MPDPDSLVAIRFRFGLVHGWGRILRGDMGVRMADSCIAVRRKRGQTLSGHTFSKSNRLHSKGSDPFHCGLLGDVAIVTDQEA